MDAIKKQIEEVQNTSQYYELMQQLGDCYASVENYDEAQRCYEKATNLSPDEAGPYVGIGVIAFSQGKLEDADISFRVACRLDNKCSRAYAGRAMIAQERKDFKGAFELYLKCMEIDPDNLTALLGLFQTSCQMGTFSEVINYLELYLDSHPGDTSVMFSLAALYMKEGKLLECSRLLKDVILLDENNSDARDLLEEVEHNMAQEKV